MKKTIFYILFLSISSCNIDTDKDFIVNKMIDEVTYLSSDKLEGRATGSDGEKLAADFIQSKFKEYGLLEKGTN